MFYDFPVLIVSKLDYHKQGNAPDYRVCNLSEIRMTNMQATDTMDKFTIY